MWAELRGKVEGGVQGCSSPVYNVEDVCMCGGEMGREEVTVYKCVCAFAQM